MYQNRTSITNGIALFSMLSLLLLGQLLSHGNGTPGGEPFLFFCGLAFLVGMYMRRRWIEIPVVLYLILAATIALGTSIAGNELNGARRWVFVGENQLVRAGPWIALFVVAGLSLMRGRDTPAQTQGRDVANGLIFFMAIAALISMPDLYSLLMIVLTSAALASRKGHPVRFAVLGTTVLVVCGLVLLIATSPFRLKRVGAWLDAVWFNPASEPLGRGWSAIQSQSALAQASWFGPGQASALPTSNLDWYALSHVISKFGIVAAIYATFCLFIFCAVLLKRARNAAPASGKSFWIAATSLYSMNAVIAVMPAWLSGPYVGHWGIPFLSSSCDIGWLGAFLGGALLMTEPSSSRNGGIGNTSGRNKDVEFSS